MSTEAPVQVVEQQQWLEPIESGLQKGVAAVYEAAGPAGRQVKNFLHGVWLGHPLHPVLTDIPIGAWTATLVLDIADASGNRACRAGADTTLKVGLAGAAAAAVSGLTDWHVIDGPARRVGVTHGLLNLTSTALYAASLIQRKRGGRAAGRWFAFAGYALSGLAAYLGGNLVYGKRIGVNHAQDQPYPQDWAFAANEADLVEGQPHRAEINSARVLLLKRSGQIYAIGEVCSHLGGPLAEGQMQGDTVQCPWHASRFSVRDGSVIDGPATHPQPCFATRVRDGRVEVRVRSGE